jgi:hypothetical protein
MNNLLFMRIQLHFFYLILLFCSCKTAVEKTVPSVTGTWQLIAATSATKDSTVSTFNPSVRMIKIINATHFAFLSHDISAAPDSLRAPFSAGGGTYTLKDSLYTERLDYFTDKKWENLQFDFTIKFSGDTLIQTGIEKNAAAGVDHLIVERYLKAGTTNN